MRKESTWVKFLILTSTTRHLLNVDGEEDIAVTQNPDNVLAIENRRSPDASLIEQSGAVLQLEIWRDHDQRLGHDLKDKDCIWVPTRTDDLTNHILAGYNPPCVLRAPSVHYQAGGPGQCRWCAG